MHTAQEAADAPQRIPEELLHFILRVPMDRRPGVWTDITGQPGDTCPVVCALPECGRILSLLDSLSPIVAVRYAGPGVDPAHCTHETADSHQHYACPEHLDAVVQHCWQNHIQPMHAANVAARDRILADRAAAAAALAAGEASAPVEEAAH